MIIQFCLILNELEFLSIYTGKCNWVLFYDDKPELSCWNKLVFNTKILLTLVYITLGLL